MGAVFGNLMVNVQTTNAKLVDRGERILMQATGVDRETARGLLAEAGSVKTAVAMHILSLHRAAAEAVLKASGGDLRKALATNPALRSNSIKL
jgi:N-acetylmuramic acid 6-phosphate etherase